MYKTNKDLFGLDAPMLNKSCDTSGWEFSEMCGDCMVRIWITYKKMKNCNKYCSKNERSCVGAWLPMGDTCQVKSTKSCAYNFNTNGPNSRAICQCSFTKNEEFSDSGFLRAFRGILVPVVRMYYNM